MRHEASTTVAPAEPKDITLPEGCILCGGPLELRIRAGSARTYCAQCRWISRPHMKRAGGNAVHVIHPAGGIA